MTVVRLYVDEDAVDRVVIQGLIAAGFDVLTSEQAGQNEAADDVQLRFALDCGRAIYSLNVRDFSRLHSGILAQGGQHFGIILFPRQRYNPKEKLQRLISLLNSTTAEELKDQIVYL